MQVLPLLTAACGGARIVDSKDAAIAEVPVEVASADAGEVWGGAYFAPNIGTNAEGLFGGSVESEGVPRLVYPIAGSMHAINLGQIRFQWAQGDPTSQVFRIRLESDKGGFDYFVGCKAPECALDMPSEEWLRGAAANAGAAVRITLSGTDGLGGAVRTSQPTTIEFSPDAVRGGLYYWSTSLQGTYRLAFGSKKPVPFIRPNSPTNPAECGGCHALSRDGRMIAFTAGAGQGDLYVAPTSDPTRPTVAGIKSAKGGPETSSSTMTLSPDGSRVLTSIDGHLTLRDTSNGVRLAQVDPGLLGDDGHAYFPEWSPDGKAVVVVLCKQQNVIDYDLATGQIAVLPFAGDAFGPATVLVPQTPADFHFYPSWSPDARWIAFSSAPIGSGGEGSYSSKGGDSSFDEPHARLRLVSVSGGQIYELANATQRVGATSTWPKFAPFVQARGDVMFVTFSSKLDVGFDLKNSQVVDPKGKRPQLWMAAIDLRRLGTGDPSFAPVWLPFQEISENNHLGFWTEAVRCSDSLAASKCAEDEECRSGICEPL